MRFRARTALLLSSLLVGSALSQNPGKETDPTPASGRSDLTWTTEAVGSQRFVAVPGRQAVVMGYPASGLEVWAYPLQLVSNYQISFLPEAQTQAISGESLLRRIEYRPDEVERVYVGDDFIVHEHIFVPLNAPGAIFTYEIEGRRNVRVQVDFHPSLNLMWPGALGGQSVSWSEELSGYVLTEPLYGFSAKVVSPDSVAHDAIGNRTVQTTEEAFRKTLILQPKVQADGHRVATLFIGYDAPGAAASTISSLENHQAELREEVTRHNSDLLSNTLEIVTPDPDLNRALAWAILALDQAWVCNASLGCGEIAGYGPSRPGRRPQYDWFFAGDGLVAVNAFLDVGEYERAREELAFVTKYQNKTNGMIWHELSQSAALVDWETKYPYMYIHVDTTFSYLTTFARYVQVSGDEAFLKVHWKNVQEAFHYCQSLIDPKTRLPLIPPGKEGANEQERMRDDLGLSSSWIAAASGFAEMARAMDSSEANSAERAADAARSAIAHDSWDPLHRFWISGHTVQGISTQERRSGPTAVLMQHVFSPVQTDQILDQLAAPEFQTDWGTRSLSAASPRYDPNSYAAGSVSALRSSEVAAVFWQQHRPLSAWQIWRALLPWSALDADGHLHEVLAGDYYHPEMESVPEQTWSSAGYLNAAVSGLLGLSVQSGKQQVIFAPHLPPQWNEISIRNVRVGAALLQLHLSRDPGGLTLGFENKGEPVSFTFSPEIPLGATLESATLVESAFHHATRAESKVPATLGLHAQDEHATTTFTALKGAGRCRIAYVGGVEVTSDRSIPLIGAGSRDLYVSSISLAGRRLTVRAFVKPNGVDTLGLDTAWKPVSVTGGTFARQAPDSYLLRFETDEQTASANREAYSQKTIMIQF